ncbi:hypothetical protein AB0C33_15045 [Nonomuraea sp. NPDC048881]|uniref:hypothetical protein n=1 Tax=Nonomuraea sp. NPDC048881 TaxID=3155030 RepID=UPI0034017D5E
MNAMQISSQRATPVSVAVSPLALRLANAAAGLGVALFVLTMAVAALGAAPGATVWNRAGGVLAGSLICLAMIKKAQAGSRGAYTRVRWITAVAGAAMMVTAVIAGSFPLWFRAEQAVHALVIGALACALNAPALAGARSGRSR